MLPKQQRTMQSDTRQPEKRTRPAFEKLIIGPFMVFGEMVTGTALSCFGCAAETLALALKLTCWNPTFRWTLSRGSQVGKAAYSRKTSGTVVSHATSRFRFRDWFRRGLLSRIPAVGLVAMCQGNPGPICATRIHVPAAKKRRMVQGYCRNSFRISRRSRASALC